MTLFDATINIRHALFAVLMALFTLVTLPPHSQGGDSQYTLGSGDVVGITVLGESIFSGDFRVRSDGHIDYPFLRLLLVQGLTSEAIEQQLTEKLKQGYLVNPQVSVRVVEFNSQRVQVLGAVVRPGRYVLKENTRILDLISLAGGVAATAGKAIMILRPSAQKNQPLPQNLSTQDGGAAADTTMSLPTGVEPIVIDYYRLVQTGDLQQNILLQNDDIINVPIANEILVLGSVARPGPVKYQNDMTALQAITAAGGPTPEASQRSTYILRQSKKGETKIAVPLNRILANRAKDIALKEDDVIFVPESFF